MKVDIISFMTAQIPYLGKFWFLSYKPKFLNPKARLSNQPYLQKKKLMNLFDFWRGQNTLG